MASGESNDRACACGAGMPEVDACAWGFGAPAAQEPLVEGTNSLKKLFQSQHLLEVHTPDAGGGGGAVSCYVRGVRVL